MSFVTPAAEQALAGLRAMMTVITAGEPLDPTRRALLTAIQQHVLHTDHDLDQLPRIAPDEVARAIPEPRLRDQLARAICLQVMVPDAPPRAEMDAARQFIEALDGAPDALERVRSMYEGRMLSLRFDAMRNSFMIDSARRMYKDEGAFAVIANFAELLGAHQNEAVANRYRALAEYPEGSLGRAYHAFYTSHGFSFPGERGGAPESIVSHDLTHVLIGLSTDLPGEACVTAFQAGYRREGAITGMQFVLMNMQKGVKMTQLAPGAKHMFGEPGMAERIVDAWSRGTQVTKDLVMDWDYWRDMDKPLAAMRQELHVHPIG